MIKTPCPLAELPVVGDYEAYERDRLNFLNECADKYGQVVRYNEWLYVIADAPLCDQLLVRTNKEFLIPRRDSIPGVNNLNIDVEVEVAQWRNFRTRLSKGLHNDTVLAHFNRTVSIIDTHLNTWASGQMLHLPKEMRALVCSLVLQHFFGDQGSHFFKDFDQYIHARLEYDNSPFFFPKWIPTPAYLRRIHTRNKALKNLKAFVHQHHQNPLSQPDLLSHFISTPDMQGNYLSEDQLLLELSLLLLLGIPNTVAALSWIWYLLMSHPERVIRLFQEIDEVVGHRYPIPEDLDQLPYLKAVIKEALRLYPPVWQFARDVARSCDLNGYKCQPGMSLHINVYRLHRDATVFADPDVFLPERWLSEFQFKTPPRGSYIPFGSGPRKCPGIRLAMQEMMLIILLIVRRFKLRLPDPSKVYVRSDIILHPKSLNMIVETRHKGY